MWPLQTPYGALHGEDNNSMEVIKFNKVTRKETKDISITALGEELLLYRSYLVSYSDPLRPLGVSLLFNMAAVMEQPGRAVIFGNGLITLTLSNIDTIIRGGTLPDGRCKYLIKCNDYSIAHVTGDTESKQYEIICSKGALE